MYFGEQSSGKSTIAKILSFCRWAEKQTIVYKKKPNLQTSFVQFFRLSKEYFSEDTRIRYESNASIIEIDDSTEFTIHVKDKDTFYNRKQLFIPAERNFVSAIPNLGRYNETNDVVMNFVYDWFTAKNQLEKIPSILKLGVGFQYEKELGRDMVLLHNQKAIPLSCASSGLQSLIPLYAVFLNFLTPAHTISFDLLEALHAEMSTSKVKNLDLLLQVVNFHFSDYIIEEPEQNLFPQTQRDLVYYLLKRIQHKEFAHRLCITTHSPYVLHAINNCLMGSRIKDAQDIQHENFPSFSSWVDSKEVGIWQLQNGDVESLQEEKTGLLKHSLLGENMKVITDEFYEMLEYLDE